MPRFVPEPIALRSVTWDFARPYVAGVVNVTPDSFSDGGRFSTVTSAVEHGEALVRSGADLLDIGGESTRPGAAVVSQSEEIDRVCPVIEALAARVEVPISIDTTKAAVARAALAAGAEVVNDISAGLFDSGVPQAAAEAGAAYIAGHVRGTTIGEVHAAEGGPITADDVTGELAAAIAALPPALGGRVIADPGLGFGKGAAINARLCKTSGMLATALQCAVMLGPSRKRFLGDITGRDVGDRDGATVGAVLAGVAAGAHLFRVHNVALVAPALAAYRALLPEAGAR